MSFYFTCRCGKIRVVIRGYKGETSSEVSDRMLCALSPSPTFSSSKLTPAISHGLLTPTASCDSQPLPGTGPNKQNGSQQAIYFLLGSELLCNFCKFFWPARLRVGSSCMINVYGVRCYARRLGASGCNAHAEAQAALGPGLRRTSHAIVQPLRPPFLSFSLPPRPCRVLCSLEPGPTLVDMVTTGPNPVVTISTRVGPGSRLGTVIRSYARKASTKRRESNGSDVQWRRAHPKMPPHWGFAE